MQKTRVGLSAVVCSALEQSRVLVEEAGHELIVKLPPEPGVCWTPIRSDWSRCWSTC